MLVELTTSLAGGSHRKTRHAGDIVDLPEREAILRIERGEAVPVRSRPVETARRTYTRRRKAGE